MKDHDEALWTAQEAALATGGALVGAREWRAQGVAIDSREVVEGDLFVALSGAVTDGSRFVANAFDAGAVAALVSADAEIEAPADAPLLKVPGDTLRALEALGRAARGRAAQLTAIGVTGSVGKTSTKEMLAAMLAPSGRTHAPVKSFNNHVGVPLTLARTPRDARFGIYEMGMNHANEIAPLSRMVRPDIAIVTAVEAVHIGNFADGIAGVAAAKSEIFEGLAQGGVAIIRRDAHFDVLARRAQAAGAGAIIDFGDAGVMARILELDARSTPSIAEILLGGQPYRLEIAAPGAHFVWNALAALAAVQAAGADLEAALDALARWSAVAGRGDRSSISLGAAGAILLVDESYNANPASMRAAIASFASAQVGLRADGAPGRRLAFLTDMRELGSSSAALHAELAAAPGLAEIDEVHAAGPEMQAFMAALPPESRGEWFENAETLAKRAPSMLEAGDSVMVKGSLGSNARLVAEAIKAMAQDEPTESAQPDG